MASEPFAVDGGHRRPQSPSTTSYPVSVRPAPPAEGEPSAQASTGAPPAADRPRQTAGATGVRAGVDRSLRTIACTAAAVVMAGSVAGAASQSPILAVALGVGLLGAVLAVVHRERRRLSLAIYEPMEQLAERSALVLRGAGDGSLDLPSDAPLEVVQATAGLRALHDRVRAGQALIRRRDAELERADDDLAQLVALTRDVGGSANVAFVMRTAARAAMAAAGAPRAVLWLKDDGVLQGHYDTQAPDAFSPGSTAVALGDGRVGAAAAANTMVVDTDGRRASGPPSAATTGAAVPMAVGGRVIGVIELIGESIVELSPQQRWVLELIASHCASVLHAARLETRADLLGRVDPVTGLANYRQFVADLAVEVERAARYDRPLALVLIDVGDGDPHGDPQAGDCDARRLDEDRLAVAATVVSGESRACDSVYRFGRGELAVLVRESSELGATVYARRLCRRLEEVSVDALPGDGLVVCAGVADLVPRAPAAGGVLGAALDGGLFDGCIADGSGSAGAGEGTSGTGAVEPSGATGTGDEGGGPRRSEDGADLLRRAGAALAVASPAMVAAAGPGPVVCWSSLSFGRPVDAGPARVPREADPAAAPGTTRMGVDDVQGMAGGSAA